MDLLCFCSVLCLLCLCKPVLSVFQTNYRLVKVLSIAECFKGSILQYFLLSMCLDPHLN